MNLYQGRPDPFGLLLINFFYPNHGLYYQENVELYFSVFALFQKIVEVGDHFWCAKLLSTNTDAFFELVNHELGNRDGFFKYGLDYGLGVRVKSFFKFYQQLIQANKRNLHDSRSEISIQAVDQIRNNRLKWLLGDNVRMILHYGPDLVNTVELGHPARVRILYRL